MNRTEAHELVATEPTYEMRYSSPACSVCGAVMIANPGMQEKHTRWHEAIAIILGPPESKFIV